MLLHWFLLSLPAFLYPCLVFAYRRILDFRRREIQSLLDRGNAAQLHLGAYGTNTVETVNRLFELNYHWRAYALPVIFNMLITTTAMVAFLLKVGVTLRLSNDIESFFQSMPDCVFAGIAGGYLWGLANVLRRYRSIALSAVSMHDMWLRMLLGAVLGWLIGKSFQPPIDLWVAFGLGVFPLKTVESILRDYVKKKLPESREREDYEPPMLQLIQGCTSPIRESLAEEGIDSAEYLAYAEPIRLLLRTRLEWKMILDLIDQSILLTYIGERIEELRLIGIRGAIEMAKVDPALSDSNTNTVDDAKRMVASIASKLGLKEVEVRLLIRTLARDPQVGFISILWGEAFEGDLGLISKNPFIVDQKEDGDNEHSGGE